MEKSGEKYDPHESKPYSQSPLNEVIITAPIASQTKLGSPNDHQFSRPVSLTEALSSNSKGQFADGQKMEAKGGDRGERCGGYWLCCWPTNQFPVGGGANFSEQHWAAGSAGEETGCCDCMYGDCGDCCDCGDCGDCGEADCGDCDFG